MAMKDYSIQVKIIDRWMELDDKFTYLYYVLMEVGNQLWLTERNKNGYN